MEIKKIYIKGDPEIQFRDSEAAHNNAAAKGFDTKDTHMYMYTKYGEGKPYDVFKNILTRHHETVYLDA